MAAFAAEDAARSGENYYSVKAFEMIPHHHIVLAAKKHRYPLWLLRLSLAAYRLHHSVGVDGIHSRLIVATRGITAGSGFATTELRILLLDIIDDTYKLQPLIGLAVYVDDMTPYLSGPSRVQVATDVAQVTDHVISTL